MSSPNVILTGFMGTGKTTVGRLLAKRLGYAFVDTDALIEDRSGQKVVDIFRQKGEAAFRRMEGAIACELAQKDGLVVSTGGRMMLAAENAAVLGRCGRVFCLVADPEEILSRVSRDEQVRRPLLEAADPLARIVELMQERAEQYGRFRQLVTTGKTPEAVAETLLALLRVDPDFENWLR